MTTTARLPEIDQGRFRPYRHRGVVEREAHHCRRGRRHSQPDHTQADGHAGSFSRRVCLSDPLSPHSPRIRRATGTERSRARQRELPHDHRCAALAVAAPDSAAHPEHSGWNRVSLASSDYSKDRASLQNALDFWQLIPRLGSCNGALYV
jgi:hypothetical protein